MSRAAPTNGRRRARRAAACVTTLATAFVSGALPLALRPAGAAAQTAAAPAEVRALDARALAERVRRVGVGTVRLSYPVRPGVCGDGANGITVRLATGETHVAAWTGRDGSWRACEPGPARVTIAVAGGVPRVLQVAVGGPWRAGTGDLGAGVPTGDVQDLGAVAGAVAAAYLLDVAARAEGGAAERAVLAAAVAGDAVVWPDLLRLARGDETPSAARRAATFWAGQFACDAVRGRAPHPSGADTADRDVRRQVVFALSQRGSGEGTPVLARVARADRDPEVRCAALFWLGQGASGAAPRALDLYDAVLRAR